MWWFVVVVVTVIRYCCYFNCLFGRRTSFKNKPNMTYIHTQILLYLLTYTHSHSPAKAAWLLSERDGEGFALHCNTTNKRSNQKTTATDRSLLYCFCTLVILAVVVVGVLCYFCWFFTHIQSTALRNCMNFVFLFWIFLLRFLLLFFFFFGTLTHTYRHKHWYTHSPIRGWRISLKLTLKFFCRDEFDKFYLRF